MTVDSLEVKDGSLKTFLNLLGLFYDRNIRLPRDICELLLRILNFEQFRLAKSKKSPDISFENFCAVPHSQIVLLNQLAGKTVLLCKNEICNVVNHQTLI